MTSNNQEMPRRVRGQPQLMFAPLAWLKLQYFCHAGDTEIAGFGITAKDDLLYIEDFVTVRQHTSPVAVAMDDEAVADFSDRCVDAGLSPQRYLRVWCHTHPGSSAQPSGTDEETFARVFGSCDWAVMFIVSRTGNAYARLSFHVGPGATTQLPVTVDWSAWPASIAAPESSLVNLHATWQAEFDANIYPLPEFLAAFSPSLIDAMEIGSPWEPFADTWEWTDLDQELLEEYERHERTYGSEFRT
jgi:proteasome lid subunit RPN8/RPN11